MRTEIWFSEKRRKITRQPKNYIITCQTRVWSIGNTRTCPLFSGCKLPTAEVPPTAFLALRNDAYPPSQNLKGNKQAVALLRKYFQVFHINFKICFRYLVLLEMISFEKIFQTVAQTLAIQCK